MANVGSTPNLDLLFLWLPAVLSVAAYVSFSARWWMRLILCLAAPLIIVMIVYATAILGSISSDYAASTIRVVVFDLRSYAIALVACVAIFEMIARLRARRVRPSKEIQFGGYQRLAGFALRIGRRTVLPFGQRLNR